VVPNISLLLCFVNLNLYNSEVAYEFDAEKSYGNNAFVVKLGFLNRSEMKVMRFLSIK